MAPRLPENIKIEEDAEKNVGKVDTAELERKYTELKKYAEDLKKMIDGLSESEAKSPVYNWEASKESTLKEYLNFLLDRVTGDDLYVFKVDKNTFKNSIDDMATFKRMQKMLSETSGKRRPLYEDFTDKGEEKNLPSANDLALGGREMVIDSKTNKEISKVEITPADYTLLRERLRRVGDVMNEELGIEVYVDVEKAEKAKLDKAKVAKEKLANELDSNIVLLKENIGSYPLIFRKNLEAVIESGEMKKFMEKAGIRYEKGQSVREFVKSMQLKLIEAGYKLKADALFGPITKKALESYVTEAKVDKTASKSKSSKEVGEKANKSNGNKKKGNRRKNLGKPEFSKEFKEYNSISELRKKAESLLIDDVYSSYYADRYIEKSGNKKIARYKGIAEEIESYNKLVKVYLDELTIAEGSSRVILAKEKAEMKGDKAKLASINKLPKYDLRKLKLSIRKLEVRKRRLDAKLKRLKSVDKTDYVKNRVDMREAEKAATIKAFDANIGKLEKWNGGKYLLRKAGAKSGSVNFSLSKLTGEMAIGGPLTNIPPQPVFEGKANVRIMVLSPDKVSVKVDRIPNGGASYYTVEAKGFVDNPAVIMPKVVKLAEGA